ncbi:hypothetical protein D2Q93_04320 [Alicyclobacillaceae bacterium I2511]|nr:hypothetical protein D2Q93_04320 [Alicyclobacillaceae bacterium I2511]
MVSLYIHQATQRETAAILGMSQSEVSRLHRKALRHIGTGMKQ